jgi:hypothetical protein
MNIVMKIITKNGLEIKCKILRGLTNGYLLVYAQDKVVVASISTATTCVEIKSIDTIDLIEGYL